MDADSTLTDFERLAHALREARWADCRFKEELVETVGDRPIAWAVFGRCSKQSLSWLRRPLTQLGDRTPLDCLSTEEDRSALRRVLMRMP
jgi:hypothetical protein